MSTNPREGDWVRNESGESPRLGCSLRVDDVVHAYRWILGREPESLDRIETHIRNCEGHPEALRTRFLRSPEFARTVERLGLGAVTTEIGGADPLPAGTPRIVFFHVPKTGGTSLHAHLAEQLPEGAISPWRQNTLLTRPALELASYSAFCGHFDRRCMDLIPGGRVVAFTVLRDPSHRLVSLYRYFRAHRPERTATEGFDLPRLARQHPFEQFLAAAMEVNPAAVDNTYMRTFGGTLPFARWERAAERQWVEKHAQPSEMERDRMLEAARAFLGQLTAVLLLERLRAALPRLLEACGLKADIDPLHLKRTDSINTDTVGFEPVESVDAGNGPMLEYCTRWDRKLYAQFASTEPEGG